MSSAAVIGRHVEHHVAHVAVEGFARKAALDEGAPRIGDLRAHRLAEQRRQLVLETFLLDVGQRHVAGIGTDSEGAKLLPLVGGLGGGADGDLLARGEIVELLAEVALWGIFRGIGRHGRQGKTGNAEATPSGYEGTWEGTVFLG